MKRLMKLLAAGLFLCAPLQAIIHEIKTYYNDATGQWLITGSDCHIQRTWLSEEAKKFFEEQTAQQVKDIVAWAQKLNATLMVECITDLPTTPETVGLKKDSDLWKTYGELKTDWHKVIDADGVISPLKNLHTLCSQHAIPTYNVECRYHNSLLSIKMGITGNNAFIAMMQSWTEDPQFLKEYYKRIIKEYRHGYAKYLEHHQVTKAFVDRSPFGPLLLSDAVASDTTTLLNCPHIKHNKFFLESIVPTLAFDVLKNQSILHNMNFLDANWLHTCYWLTKNQPTHHKVIISLCGFFHHREVEILLPLLGFTEIKEAHFGAPALIEHENHFADMAHVLSNLFFINFDTVFGILQKAITAVDKALAKATKTTVESSSSSSTSSSSSSTPQIQSKL